MFASGADPGPIAAAFAQVPELCEAALPYFGSSLSAGSTGVRLKEIAILRTSALLECRYCVAAHTVVAIDTGLSLDEVQALRGDLDPTTVFVEEGERSLLAWIAEVALGRGPVSAATSESMRVHYDDYEIVELTNCIGVTMLLNRFCTALDLPTPPETAARLVAEGFST